MRCCFVPCPLKQAETAPRSRLAAISSLPPLSLGVGKKCPIFARAPSPSRSGGSPTTPPPRPRRSPPSACRPGPRVPPSPHGWPRPRRNRQGAPLFRQLSLLRRYNTNYRRVDERQDVPRLCVCSGDVISWIRGNFLVRVDLIAIPLTGRPCRLVGRNSEGRMAAKPGSQAEVGCRHTASAIQFTRSGGSGSRPVVSRSNRNRVKSLRQGRGDEREKNPMPIPRSTGRIWLVNAGNIPESIRAGLAQEGFQSPPPKATPPSCFLLPKTARPESTSSPAQVEREGHDSPVGAAPKP